MRDATLPPLRPKWPLSRSTAVSDPRVAPLPPPVCAMRRVHDKRLPRRRRVIIGENEGFAQDLDQYARFLMRRPAVRAYHARERRGEL